MTDEATLPKCFLLGPIQPGDTMMAILPDRQTLQVTLVDDDGCWSVDVSEARAETVARVQFSTRRAAR